MHYPGRIGKLTCLQTLTDFEVKEEYNKLDYLKSLNQLRGSVNISIMVNLDVAVSANANLKSKKHIEDLTLNFSDLIRKKEDVMEPLEPPPNIQILNLINYGGTRLATWLTSLKYLRHLNLRYFLGLTSLPSFGILPLLEKLEIADFVKLKSVGPEFLGIRESLLFPSVGFPKLEELQFINCEGWEEWEDITPEEEDHIVALMPQLRWLTITECWNLKYLPCRLLRKASSLEFIQLDGKKYDPPTISATSLTVAGVKARQSNHQSTSTKEAVQLERLQKVIADVWSDDSNLQLLAASQFNALRDKRWLPVDEVIQSRLIFRFVEFLAREDFPQLQFQAAWALRVMACGTSKYKRVILDHGAVPSFVKLLGSPRDDVREQALLALGLIAGDSPECRDLILEHGALMPLLLQLNEEANVMMLKLGAWVLLTFCYESEYQFEQMKRSLPTLQRLINSNEHEEVLSCACKALSYLSGGKSNQIQAVIEAGVCQRLVELLLHPSPTVLIPALQTVRNIVRGDDVRIKRMIDHGPLPRLLSLLTNNHANNIKEEACRTISNITAGNKDQIEVVIEAGLIAPLLNLLQTAEFDVKKWAAWAISNATCRGTHDQIKFLVSERCIKPLCDLLVCPDPKTVTVCLIALENILEVGGVEKTQGNTDDVYSFAQMIEEAEGLEKIKNLLS